MSRLYFDYRMEIEYESMVSRCYYTIKGIPSDSDRQKIVNCQIEMFPQTKWSEGADSFGNRKIYGEMDTPHDRFRIRIAGEAVTGPLDSDGVRDTHLIGRFRHPYGFTVPGEALIEYVSRLKAEHEIQDKSSYDLSVFLMHQLYQNFRYQQGVTDVATAAETAWKLGHGVCQDYAHILIAMCRQCGIPARYVAGMMIGEGHTHAWVEVLCGDRWYGLDPTHDCAVDDNYIVIGTGRDASDCALNRGIIFGGGAQHQTVSVKVDRGE